MAEVEFSNAAEADLADIDEYSFAQFGDEVAETYMHGFDEAFRLLADHPQAGPAMPDLFKGIRCLVHRRHRIFYRVDREIVLIVRVVHHARDARRALGKAKG